jgi:hypothetical protein
VGRCLALQVAQGRVLGIIDEAARPSLSFDEHVNTFGWGEPGVRLLGKEHFQVIVREGISMPSTPRSDQQRPKHLRLLAPARYAFNRLWE